MWLMIFGAIALLALGGLIYLVRGVHRFRAFEQLAEKHRLFSWVLACLPVAALSGIYFLINAYTIFVIVIQLTVIWMLCDLAAFIIRKCLHRERTRNYAGGAAVLLTAAVFGIGWYFAHHVYETDYHLTTDKSLSAPLRIAMLADSHLSITLNGQEFAAQLDRIQAQNPDMLLICGDFVDDDTKRQDLLDACAALGKMQTKYGIYYVYGNHDLGYFRYRDFTADELRQALAENGVTLLADETEVISEHISVTGRLDANADRAEISALAADADTSLYRILLDHQPTDYDAEAAAGYDLVLSGHTHGGHIFPAGQIGLVISENDALYGHEKRGNTDFIITSGISGWAIPFKTGCISEYCIIDVEP